MDSRLEMERQPAQRSSKSAASDGTELQASTRDQPRAASGTPAASEEELQSLDPLRATDRYRLVMPYSLRL